MNRFSVEKLENSAQQQLASWIFHQQENQSPKRNCSETVRQRNSERRCNQKDDNHSHCKDDAATGHVDKFEKTFCNQEEVVKRRGSFRFFPRYRAPKRSLRRMRPRSIPTRPSSLVRPAIGHQDL